MFGKFRDYLNMNIDGNANSASNLKKPLNVWQHLGIVLGLVVAAIGIQQLDFWITDVDRMKDLPGDVNRVFMLSEIFAHGFGLFVILLGIWQLVPDKRRFIPRIAACALFPSLCCLILKSLIGRRRPLSYRLPENWSIVEYPADIGQTWIGWWPEQTTNLEYMMQSFPSAHTATALGLAIGMSHVFPRGWKLFWLVAILAASQRVVSLAHWPSDVLAGAAIAFAIAGSLNYRWTWLGLYLEKLENRFAPSSPQPTNQEKNHTLPNRHAA